MKKVFPSAEQTIHVWAQQSQETGQCSNVFFENTKVLYSYGYHFPLAVFLDDDTVLINDSSYSVTTRKHQGIAWCSVSHKDVMSASTRIMKCVMSYQDYGVKKFFKKELIKLVTENIKIVVETQARQAAKRRKKELIQEDIAKAENVLKNFNELLQFFKFKMPVATVRLVDDLVNNHVEVVAKFAKLHEKEVAKRERVRKQREKELLVIAEEAIELWKAGGAVKHYDHVNALRKINTVYMRPWGDDKQIHTSHGARFPVNHGIAAFKHILDCRKNGEGWKANGHRINLGHFSIDKIDTKGNVTAGCHYVEFSEIERNAKLLKLI